MDTGDVSGFPTSKPVDSEDAGDVTGAGPHEFLDMDTRITRFDSPPEFDEEIIDPMLSNDVTMLPATGPRGSTSPQDCHEVEGTSCDISRSDVSSS